MTTFNNDCACQIVHMLACLGQGAQDTVVPVCVSMSHFGKALFECQETLVIDELVLGKESPCAAVSHANIDSSLTEKDNLNKETTTHTTLQQTPHLAD